MTMAGGEALKTTEFQGVVTNATLEKPHLTVVKSVQVDRSRDALLTDFGKKTLEDRYLLAGESYQDMFAFAILGLILIFRPQGLLGERVSDRA